MESLVSYRCHFLLLLISIVSASCRCLFQLAGTARCYRLVAFLWCSLPDLVASRYRRVLLFDRHLFMLDCAIFGLLLPPVVASCCDS